MLGRLWWEDQGAAHIRCRSMRYPGADDIGRTGRSKRPRIRIAWCDPDPKGRVGYTRIIGYSPTAGFVITVIADPADGSGVTAWKTRGADLREYLAGKESHS